MPYNSHSARGKNKSAHHTTNFQLKQNSSLVYKDQSNCKLRRYLYRPSSVCLYLQASKMNHTYSSEFLHRKSPSITSKEGMMTFPPAFTHTVSVFYQISNFQQLGSKRPETLEKPNNIFVKFPLKINIIEFQDAKRVPCTCSPEWIAVSGTTFKQVSSLQEEFHNLLPVASRKCYRNSGTVFGLVFLFAVALITKKVWDHHPSPSSSSSSRITVTMSFVMILSLYPKYEMLDYQPQNWWRRSRELHAMLLQWCPLPPSQSQSQMLSKTEDVQARSTDFCTLHKNPKKGIRRDDAGSLREEQEQKKRKRRTRRRRSMEGKGWRTW